ncbi:MAG: arginine N-succinyltransferase [Bdellovibrionaceae bacterium]|nr:arginine N-succinyltransferase [Bdellovibrionales bacterium]MCB9085529.1 arginine N-succinyltransferase [Pseudobdellovibrionaceae bacterium]
MNFVVRMAQPKDVQALYELARQFTLLNLPADKKALIRKVELSGESFRGKREKRDAEYIFVVEDLESGFIAASAQVLAKNGIPKSPNYSFEVLKKERFSQELGIGFIHQILRLRINEDGATELGGLVVDRGYRRRPEKVGKIASLTRFAYIALNRDRFEEDLHAEMAPPLTDEGRSEFWESLGRRFTGMPYKEADILSQQNNSFIRSLFPEEDIYLCLLDSKARLVLGRVGEETQAALHMLEGLGFKYKNEVDPFDGGPHLGVRTDEVATIKNGAVFVAAKQEGAPFDKLGVLGSGKDQRFRGGVSPYGVEGEKVFLPEQAWQALKVKEGSEIFVSPL